MPSRAEQLLEQGKIQQALPLFVEQCEKTPHDAQAWFLLGACNHQTHKLEEALQALERALSLEPRHIQARCAKAAVLCDLGRREEALHVYRKALHLAPTDAQLLLNIGIVIEQTGDLHAALERYELALKHRPEFASAMLNRGALLIRLGRLEEARGNNSRLAELHPDWEHAQFNLGEVLLALGRWDEALAAYERARAINPGSAKIHFAIGLALAMLQHFDSAQQEFSAARTLDPGVFDQCINNAAALSDGEMRDFSPRVIYLLREAARLDSCDWSNWDKLVRDFELLVNATPGDSAEMGEPALAFRAIALPGSGATSLALARSVAARMTIKVASLPPFTHARQYTGKLRIGYVSPDFRIHPTATLTRRLYALHDRDQFEVYGYSLHPGDGSSIRRDIEHGCDVFRELSGLDDRTAAEIIHRDGVDILIDLAGYTRFSRPEIFAMRPVPLQVGYLGFPQTTGADFIDYFLADPIVISSAVSQYFSEKIVYLPDSYFLFDNRQEISTRQFSREELGLPAQGFVFCCHNSNHKITPKDFDLWMRLLQRVAGSVLWLYQDSEAVAENLRKEAVARGVNSDSLVFATSMPNAEHLARYRLADLFLDTTFYNAHTTAAEALWAGLPVLTCTGATMASRVASSLLTAVGLEEMITDSHLKYEERACHLASHADELRRIREKLAGNRLAMPLFDTVRQVRNLEIAYQTMFQRHAACRTPESFHVAVNVTH